VIPKIHLVAFESRQPAFIFVAVPDEVGRYMRTDRSVILTSCPVCRSSSGEPCKSGKNGAYCATTHFLRRRRAKSLSGAIHDVVLPVKKRVAT
jgi:hypothetical protein